MTLIKHGVRSFVLPKRGMTEVDIAHQGVQEMVALGAKFITDFAEVKPTPKDIHKHGDGVRVFTAVGYREMGDAA